MRSAGSLRRRDRQRKRREEAPASAAAVVAPRRTICAAERATLSEATFVPESALGGSQGGALTFKITARKRALIYPDFGHAHLPGFADEVYRFLSEL